MDQSEKAKKSARLPPPILRKDTLILRTIMLEVYAMDKGAPDRARKRVRFEAPP